MDLKQSLIMCSDSTSALYDGNDCVDDNDIVDDHINIDGDDDNDDLLFSLGFKENIAYLLVCGLKK